MFELGNVLKSSSGNLSYLSIKKHYPEIFEKVMCESR
jgi:hypothetical protein